MVDLREKESLGHDSTIYVLSQLPIELCDEIFQSLTGSQHTFKADPDHPWSFTNRYYSAQVQFSLFDSAAHLQNELKQLGKDDIPALVLLVDNSKSVEESLLLEFESDSIDVPLVIGKSVHTTSEPLPWEDMMQKCISLGWEYIDATDTAEDAAGGQSGIARVSEALQAHIWPSEPRRRPVRGRSSSSRSAEQPSSEQDMEATAASEAAPRSRARKDSDASSGFDDDFAPFITAESKNVVLADAPTSPSFNDFRDLEETAFPGRQTTLDDSVTGNKDDDEDPTAHLADMFASLLGLREKAMGIQDHDKRLDFAEDIALKFAKQLDLLLENEDKQDSLKESSPPLSEHEDSVREAKPSDLDDDEDDESSSDADDDSSIGSTSKRA